MHLVRAVSSVEPSSGSHHGPPSFAFEPVTTRAIAQLLQARPFPKLVTVTAPPGYGKTVLLSRLHREFVADGQRCLWLTLDDRDADASSLIYRLRTALGQAGVTLPADVTGPQAAFHDRAAPLDSIVHVLAALQGPTRLFLDNLGYCEDKALAPLLERLVFGTGAELSLALSSTREIPVDVVRAKLELGAIELRARHLSFDRAGTAQMLEQAGISATTEQDLDHIMAQTEGWPAAVRLLQVLLAAEQGVAPDIDNVLRRFGGDQGDVARVLTHRVLVGFKPELVRFMVELALIREFNADLAIHMTGQAAARGWLDMLVSRNVLTFPLDSSRRWFRFHTLMRDFLLAEAGEVLSTERRRELLERAAQWHREQGDNVAAIGIALEAGSIALAQELLDRIARVVVGDQGQMGSLIRWVDRLIEAGAEPSLEAHAWYVWALCDSLQYERARKALDEFDRRVAADGGGVHSRLLFLRMLVNVFIDRLDIAYDQATAWLESGAAADALTMSTVISIAGIAEIDRGELAAARVRMDRARAAIDRSDSAYGLAWVCILRACVEIGQARPAAADELLRAGREQVVRAIGNDASVVVTLDFVHARALLDLGRSAPARELALRGLARAMHHGIVGSLEQGLIASVAFWGGAGDDGVQEPQLDTVANCYPTRGPALLSASKVRRLLALGRHADAQAEADRIALCASRRPKDAAPMRERGDWLLARLELQLAQGACEAVLGQVESLLNAARLQGRDRDRIEVLLVAADAHQRMGQTRMALRHLAMAITLAVPGRLNYPFQVRQGPLQRLLASSDASGLGLIQPAEQAFFERLFKPQALPGTPAPPNAAELAAAGVLTMREVQMLSLLDDGLSNEQVADRLALSVATVKWHLHNAYVKLGVRGRSAALARARALHLFGR